MSNTDAHFHQLFQPKSQVNKYDENPVLLANRLTPTDDQIRDWLQQGERTAFLKPLLYKDLDEKRG